MSPSPFTSCEPHARARSPSTPRAALVGALLVLSGCAATPPEVFAEQVLASNPKPAALVVITPSGLEPAGLALDAESEVVFCNATGARLVLIVVDVGDPEFVRAAATRGFVNAGPRTVCDPPLAPGEAAVLGIPRGAKLDYRIPGTAGAPDFVGRIERRALP